MVGKVGAQKLSNLTKIPKTKIDSWLRGRVQRPRDWRLIVTIAQALLLTREETDSLLLSAHQPTLAELAEQLAPEHPDRRHLQPWLGAAPAAPSARHQLRTPVGDFVGRSAELATLADALQMARAAGGTAAIAGALGMGGIGKTELAYAAAHRGRSSFPDAQIVLALGGASAAPISPEQALQMVIRAFAPEARLPDSLPELEALYRTQLHAKRVLILADDARDAAQVRPLLPPGGSALLVTSRVRFTLPGMTALDLDQLAPAEAQTLLRQICARLTDAEAADLARACVHLPLALRVSASTLQNNPAISMEHYIRQLADARQRLIILRDPDDPQLDVETSLALSYAQLDPLEQAVFRQLGVLVADFTTALAQEVIDVSHDRDITASLHTLLRRNLVLYDPERARWRLHDLLRGLAWRQLEEAGEMEATLWRYARGAAQMASHIQDQFLEGGDRTLLALARFDAERPHIDSARSWAERHAGTPEGDQLFIDVVRAIRFLLELRYDPRHEILPMWESARSAARRLGNRIEESRALNNLGVAHMIMGEPLTAMTFYKQGLDLARELGDRRGEGYALCNLGNVCTTLGETTEAIGYYEQDLAIAREIGDRRGEITSLGNLGSAYKMQGEIGKTVSYYERALAIARELGDHVGECRSLSILSNTYTDLGNQRKAVATSEEALSIARAIGHRQEEGYALSYLARARALQGDRAEADPAFAQTMTLLQEVGDRLAVAKSQWSFGLALVQHGWHEHALPLLRDSLAYRQEIGHAKAAEYAALLARLEAGDPLPPELLVPLAEQAVEDSQEPSAEQGAQR
jgi:tetratricopeptide (TPR) repeat protein